MSQPPEQHQHAVKGSEVFVGGLPQTITESKISEIFSHCGEIVEIRLIKDQKGGVKGYCFVRFATKEAAEKAVTEKNGVELDGKKIGVLPSMEQNTLYFGNLNKGWSDTEFEGIVRQVFPDVVSVELAMPLSSGETQPGRKLRNRGFAFVKFSSHAAAARAYRVGSKPDFVLGGNLHPTVQWAEEGAEIDPAVLAKVKIAFVRNLPTNADENYLKKLFENFGTIEKVVVWSKGSPPVGFVHFTKRSDLDKAIKEMNEKTVQGPNGGPPHKLTVEVARPMDKSKKRAREDSESKVPDKIPNVLLTKPNVYASGPISLGLMSEAQKELEYEDPYEAAVLSLPASLRERLIRILRLGVATRYDIDIQSLNNLKELPESSAISVLDQFMLSAGDSNDKRIYLAALISRYQVDKIGLSRFAGGLSRVADTASRDSELYSFSNRVHVDSTLPSFSTRVNHPATGSIASPSGLSLNRPDGYISRYTGLLSDTLPSHEPLGRMKERSSSPSWKSSTSSLAYERFKLSPPKISAAAVDFQFSRPQLRSDTNPQIAATAGSTRPRMRFDPFTGEPYKFDPFTGERILPDDLPRRF